MNTNKAIQLLKSRKFWASIVGLLVALGWLRAGDEAQLVEAILTIAVTASYVIGTGIEDINKGTG